MDKLTLIRKINAIGEKYYSKGNAFEHNHNCYLDECNYWLIKFLRQTLSDTYLFYVLTYMHKDGEVGFVNKYDCSDKKRDDRTRYDYHESIKEDFEKILEDEYLPDIESGIIISMTENLLKKKTGFDIFFQGKEKYGPPINAGESSDSKILFFNLYELGFDSQTQMLESNSEHLQGIANRLKIEGTTEQIKNLLSYYKRLEHDYKQKFPGKDFMVHFIRPYFIDFDYNLLFSLATSQPIDSETLSFINLILYKIVGLMVTERVKENEILKRKKSFSLTTHGLKTELNTTLIPQVKLVKKHINSLNDPPKKLVSSIDKLNEQILNQYHLTGLNSLIDKIDDPRKFTNSGLKDNLLSNVAETIKLGDYINEFNQSHPEFPNIILSHVGDLPDFFIPIFDKFFGRILIKLFYDTLFENIVRSGTRVDNEVVMTVSLEDDGRWVFKNSMLDERYEYDEKKLRGNLSLFQTLIEGTQSGEFSAGGEDYTFEVSLKVKYHE